MGAIEDAASKLHYFEVDDCCHSMRYGTALTMTQFQIPAFDDRK